MNITRLRLLLSPVVGSLIVNASYGLDIYLDVYDLRIRPVHIIVLLIWFFAIEFFYNRRRQFHGLIVGASLAIVAGYFLNQGEFSGTFSQAPFFVLAGISGSFLLLPSLLNPKNHKIPYSSSWAIIYSMSALFIVIFFRLSNILLRNVPNEERSLMIAGIEVHHIISGLLLLSIATCMVLNFPSKSRIVFIFSALGLAMIGDQISYFMIYPLTDAAFFTPFSFMGAILATGWLIYRLNYAALRERKGHGEKTE